MVSSNAMEVTINFFLLALRKQNPQVIPNKFMSDRDHRQLNAVRRQYPESVLYLCWWHVLHAWQQHFVTTQFSELWEILKKWIRVTDEDEFEAYWTKISSFPPNLAPTGFWEYINTFWIPYKKMWSAVYRKERTVFELCDTNMLVEA